jgi:hypothetical protein
MVLDLASHASWIFEGSLKKRINLDCFAASHELQVRAREVTFRRHLIYLYGYSKHYKDKIEVF